MLSQERILISVDEYHIYVQIAQDDGQPGRHCTWVPVAVISANANPIDCVFCHLVWFASAASMIYRLHQAGVLSMSPMDIYRLNKKPRIGFIEWLAVTGGGVVLMMLSRQ